MSNLSNIDGFLLLAFSGDEELPIVHFVVFLAMYMIVLLGNLLVITLIVVNTHLHTPMYFFLVNLSIIDLGSTSVTIPKSMVNSLMNRTQISYSECVAQVLFIVLFLSADIFLLTVMAYDRYVAICHPLHYVYVMNWGACFQMTGGAWAAGFLNALIQTGITFSMPFCSTIVHQFFCDIPQLLKLSCSNLNAVEYGALIFSISLGLGCFIFIILSYVQIFATVLRMPTLQKRQKAFSTCIPHLLVVSLFICTAIFAYLLPTSHLNQVFTVIYSVLPPMMNPIIYSIRNKDVKTALWKLFAWELLTKANMSHIHL